MEVTNNKILMTNVLKNSNMELMCDICKHISSSKSNLESHRSIVHEGIKFKCELCDKEFSTPRGVKSHKESVHLGIRLCRVLFKTLIV